MKINTNSEGLKFFLIALCIILSIVIYTQRKNRRHLQEAAKLPFYNVQPSEVADGAYVGSTELDFCSLQVEVTVQKGKMTAITVLKEFGVRAKKPDLIIQKMLEKNSSVVQAEKGDELATLIFVSCVDNALMQGAEAYSSEK